MVTEAVPRQQREGGDEQNSNETTESHKGFCDKDDRPNEALHPDPPDKLLLSALKYWEVKRDLIEERMASERIRSGCFLAKERVIEVL